MKITRSEKIVQWVECCDEPLRKDLTRSAGCTLPGTTEHDVLEKMKRVIEENMMVAWVTLRNTHQDHDETVRSFRALLHDPAGVCKFVIKCPNCESDLTYIEEILHNVLTSDIMDHEIQVDLIGYVNENMTFDIGVIFKFVVVKKTGKHSSSHLVVLLAGLVSHTSIQYMDFIEISNVSLDLSTIYFAHLSGC